jgi:hypothetical protein
VEETMNLDRIVSTDGQASPIAGLHVTPTAPLPFISGFVVKSFVLERKQGNVIVYNSPGVTAAAREILHFGRPSRLLVNHWHEALYPAPELDTPIFVHEHDRAQTERSLPVAGTFTGRGMIDDDIEVIPTPGHTAGSTMFLWHSGEHRFLFPGDTIWIQDGQWKVAVLGESDRAAYLDSLALIRDVDFDVLVPWASEQNVPQLDIVSRSQVQEQIGQIIARVQNGADQ